MKNPKISIITVCFNAKETIEQTIKSVLAQSYRNIEYIIIDGGSNDGTIDIIKKYGLQISKWISEPDNGIYDAMNKGIKIATGDWIHFRNSGDYFVSKYSLEKMFANKIDESIGVLHGNCYYINYEGYIEHTPNILSKPYTEIMPILHPATFVRTDIQKNNLFDTVYKSSADYNLFYSLCKMGIKMQYIPIPVATYDEGGFSSNWQRAFFEDRKIQGKDLKRLQIIVSKMYCKKKEFSNWLHDLLINHIPAIRKRVMEKRKNNQQLRSPLPFPYDYSI